jgi:hypothetical protein
MQSQVHATWVERCKQSSLLFIGPKPWFRHDRKPKVAGQGDPSTNQYGRSRAMKLHQQLTNVQPYNLH